MIGIPWGVLIMRTKQFIRNKSQGFSTLLLSLVVLFAVTILSFMSANTILSHLGTVKSHVHASNAFNAAQAGLDYAVTYLDANRETVNHGDTVQVNLTNGGFAVIAFNFEDGNNVIRVVSTGHTADGAISRSVQQIMQYQSGDTDSFIVTPVPQAAFAREDLDMRSNAIVRDLEGGAVTVNAGSAIKMFDYAKTVLESGNSSVAGSLQDDVISNDTDLMALTNDALEELYLGQPLEVFQTVTTQVTLPSNAGTPQGTYIYDYTPSLLSAYGSGDSYTINQHDGEAQFKGDHILGGPENPVNLEVNLSGTYTLPSGVVKTSEFQLRQNAVIYGDVIIHGNAHFSSNVKVYGNVIVEGTLHTTDNVIITGAIIARGEVRLHMNSIVNGVVYSQTGDVQLYHNSIINGSAIAGRDVYLRNNAIINYEGENAKVIIKTSGGGGSSSGYGKLAGSWTDLASAS